MGPPFDEVAAKLTKLGLARDRFVMRTELLPADLALAGLLNEIRDAAFLAMELCHLHAQPAAFPLARKVFEATQQLMVLATEDDYLGVGTRAWLFHRRKEKRVAEYSAGTDQANKWFEHAVRDIERIWSVYNPDAEEILRRENAQLDAPRQKGWADNFMGRNLGKVVEDRYSKVSAVLGMSAAELAELNSGIYAALSRESHAHLRLDPASLRVAPDGTFTIVEHTVDELARNKLVLGCISSSLDEATVALKYTIAARERRQSAELRAKAARLTEQPLPPGFKPDLGLQLLRAGGASTTFHFSNVPVQKVGILPDGTVSWSAEITLEDQEVYTATFDIPGPLLPELTDVLGADIQNLKPSAQLKRHVLPQPIKLQLDCTLGNIQQAFSDSFVPLRVTKLSIQDSQPKKPN